jgi:hypothetical protein
MTFGRSEGNRSVLLDGPTEIRLSCRFDRNINCPPKDRMKAVFEFRDQAEIGEPGRQLQNILIVRSTSLPACSSPRAIEPKSEMLTTPDAFNSGARNDATI